MPRISLRSVAGFVVIIAIAFSISGERAGAAVDMSIGTRSVVQNGPASQCSTRAKNALNSVLQNAAEAGAGTGQWFAYGPRDSSGNSSVAATIHCFPVGKGYVASFTCAVEVPPSAESASALCTKLTGSFGSAK